jgi:hypothetical protein
MDSKEILKAIDPKGAEIGELQEKLGLLEGKITFLQDELWKDRKKVKEHDWMREHGVLIETPDGMRYLKDEEFTEFFDKLGVADTVFEKLAKSMQETKDAVAGKILSEVFENTYAERSEQIAKELTNGTNTREKGKRSRNKNS